MLSQWTMPGTSDNSTFIVVAKVVFNGSKIVRLGYRDINENNSCRIRLETSIDLIDVPCGLIKKSSNHYSVVVSKTNVYRYLGVLVNYLLATLPAVKSIELNPSVCISVNENPNIYNDDNDDDYDDDCDGPETNCDKCKDNDQKEFIKCQLVNISDIIDEIGEIIQKL